MCKALCIEISPPHTIVTYSNQALPRLEYNSNAKILSFNKDGENLDLSHWCDHLLGLEHLVELFKRLSIV